MPASLWAIAWDLHVQNTINGASIFALGRETHDSLVVLVVQYYAHLKNLQILKSCWTKYIFALLHDVWLFILQRVSFLQKNLWVSKRVKLLSSIKDSSNTLTNSCLNFRYTIIPSAVEYCSTYAKKCMFLCSIDLPHTWTLSCLSSFLLLSNKDHTFWWWFSFPDAASKHGASGL